MLFIRKKSNLDKFKIRKPEKIAYFDLLNIQLYISELS
jgi:hypothetical protein